MAPEDKKQNSTGLWLIGALSIVLVCLVTFAGITYSAVRQAQMSAAKASIGHIEASLYLAEHLAEESGYGPAPDVYKNVLRSYGEEYGAGLSPQERYVLDALMSSFGPMREFDFAITRVADGAGVQTQIYFFPTRGKTDTRRDRYYLLSGGQVVAKNG